MSSTVIKYRFRFLKFIKKNISPIVLIVILLLVFEINKILLLTFKISRLINMSLNFIKKNFQTLKHDNYVFINLGCKSSLDSIPAFKISYISFRFSELVTC